MTAETAGFCFGVQRAVELAEKTAQNESEGILTFGPLIHNDTVISDLERKQIRAIPAELSADFDIEAAAPPDSDTILIRAHGVGRETEAALHRRFTRVVDATCPFVKKIHRLVWEHSKAGEQIVIFGSPKHPEVIGISGWAEGKTYVVSDENEAKTLSLDPDRKTCIVAQTTFHFNKFQDLVEIIKEKVYDVVAYNTICNATEERQNEAARLAERVDAMLVIGGKDSSNTKKLYEICRNIVDTQFLQTADDLDWEALSNAERIGITAGASTPHYIIEEVQRKCQKKVLSKC